MDVSPVQQYRIRHKTKGYRWVETYTALIDFDGQPASVPVLFVSGNIEFIEAIKPLMEKDRFVAHLSKPCRMGAYVEHVNQMLAG
jgi:hypothetical protein